MILIIDEHPDLGLELREIWAISISLQPYPRLNVLGTETSVGEFQLSPLSPDLDQSCQGSAIDVAPKIGTIKGKYILITTRIVVSFVSREF